MRISSSIENKIYFNKYKVDSKIGQGSFGNIYSAHHIQNGEKYALKLEKKKWESFFIRDRNIYSLLFKR